MTWGDMRSETMLFADAIVLTFISLIFNLDSFSLCYYMTCLMIVNQNYGAGGLNFFNAKKSLSTYCASINLD